MPSDREAIQYHQNIMTDVVDRFFFYKTECQFLLCLVQKNMYVLKPTSKTETNHLYAADISVQILEDVHLYVKVKTMQIQ